jgi:hypothetical protein
MTSNGGGAGGDEGGFGYFSTNDLESASRSRNSQFDSQARHGVWCVLAMYRTTTAQTRVL